MLPTLSIPPENRAPSVSNASGLLTANMTVLLPEYVVLGPGGSGSGSGNGTGGSASGSYNSSLLASLYPDASSVVVTATHLSVPLQLLTGAGAQAVLEPSPGSWVQLQVSYSRAGVHEARGSGLGDVGCLCALLRCFLVASALSALVRA